MHLKAALILINTLTMPKGNVSLSMVNEKSVHHIHDLVWAKIYGIN